MPTLEEVKSIKPKTFKPKYLNFKDIPEDKSDLEIAVKKEKFNENFVLIAGFFDLPKETVLYQKVLDGLSNIEVAVV